MYWLYETLALICLSGIGYVSRKLAANRSAEMDFSVEGADIHISVRSQDWLFKLDETVVNLVDKTRQSVSDFLNVKSHFKSYSLFLSVLTFAFKMQQCKMGK